MIEVLCHKCEKEFEYNESLNGNSLSQALSDTDEYTCYSCALRSLTGGRAPEEGDFNSARLISGEISEKELKWLMEDLHAIETGQRVKERYDDEDDEQYRDSLTDLDYCPNCYDPVYDDEPCSNCNPQEDSLDFDEE